MKKYALGIVLAAVLTVPSASAQTIEEHTVEGAYHTIVSKVSEEHAQTLAREAAALFEFYNSYFHFEPENLRAPLKIRVFDDRAEYNQYLGKYIDAPQEDYVYLHYNDPSRSELVGVHNDSAENTQALSHQGFIQFLRAFVPNPPLWLREGFAVYFEYVQFDPEFDTVSYRENLAWLETLKSDLEHGLFDDINLEGLLSMDINSAEEKLEEFYPRAWGLVSFLLHSPVREYNRLLWDAISALEPAASLQENSETVISHSFRWIDDTTLTEDLHFYIDNRQTFRGLVQDGVDLYANDELVAAEQRFIRALNLQDSNYIPFYYLGLINYARSNYSLAEFYYNTALDLGADKAVTMYALGVNAYADEHYDEATSVLEEALTLDSEEYREQIELLLVRIQEEA